MSTFVVEVDKRPDGISHEGSQTLVEAFGLTSRNIDSLLDRLPGVITKPIPENEASVIASYFRQAGLEAEIKLYSDIPQFDGTAISDKVESLLSGQVAPEDIDIIKFIKDNNALMLDDLLQEEIEEPLPIIIEPAKFKLAVKLRNLVLWPAVLSWLGTLGIVWFVLRPSLELLLLTSLLSFIPFTLITFFMLARVRTINQPLLTLVKQVDDLSKGKLDEPIHVFSRDELEDLAGSVERLRISMREAIERLRRRRL